MPKHGLTKDAVLDAAEELIEAHGASHLTTGTLAKKLGIKPASLYNHITSTEELRQTLAERAAGRLSSALNRAIDGKMREDACFALADAYRTFVHNSPGLYHLILMIPISGMGMTDGLSGVISAVFGALDGFTLTEGERTHWQRMLRTVMHGFSTQELWGFFSHGDADRDETYRLAVKTVTDSILSAERGNTTPKEDTTPHD